MMLNHEQDTQRHTVCNSCGHCLTEFKNMNLKYLNFNLLDLYHRSTEAVCTAIVNPRPGAIPTELIPARTYSNCQFNKSGNRFEGFR